MLDVIKYAVFGIYYGIVDWLVGILCFIAKRKKEASMKDYENGKITRSQYVDAVKRLEQAENLRLKLQASRS